MAKVALDSHAWSHPVDVMKAVVSNLSGLKNDERERVLLAAAVFYGIIKPEPAQSRPLPHDTKEIDRG